MNSTLNKLRRSVFSLLFASAAVLFFAVLAVVPPSLADAALSHADKTAYSYIISPSDGQTVPEEFTVRFGLSGMGIAPAGIDKNGTGHHHLLIDVDELPNLTEPLAATSYIRHFGGGQTEATISLLPGPHTLQLLLANYTHVPHDNPVLSDKIEVTVE
ncbi:MAG: DUF4399 domain-containing protein [Phormidesmis sp.]